MDGCGAFLLLIALFPAADVEADYVLRGATVYDGAGVEGRPIDVAIKGERIVALGAFKARVARREIDATGLIIAPGFIDLHNHSDRGITKDETRANLNYLMQGVTTIVTGNCGGGRADVSEYLDEVDRGGAGTNVAHLIPHGQLRKEVMQGSFDRPPTPAELRQLRARVQKAMRAGAFGMSTGLIYVPSSFAKTDELIELAKAVSEHDGIYVSHMRNEGSRVLEAIEETLEIGAKAKLPVHVSHFKTSGPAAWGLAPEAINLIKRARDDGRVVTADQYPYVASSTSLGAMVVPRRYRAGKEFKLALKDAKRSTELRQAIEKSVKGRNGGESLFIAGYKKNRAWQGKNLAQLAEKTGRSAVDLVIEIQSNGGAQMVSFSMREEDVRLIMRQPFVATASDGSAKLITDSTVPHPRSYGCFPRKIGFYCLEGKVIELAKAIHSSTGLPAKILGLKDRGLLKKGRVADIVVFDPRTFRDTATFDKPHQYSTGVRYLFVNGELTIDGGKYTEALAGRSLRKVDERKGD